MPAVYVVGGYQPNGGTRMAYALGRLAHQAFGFDGYVIQGGAENGPPDRFEYDAVFPVLALAEAEQKITPDDLLICNPSFSRLDLGARLACRKIMYVQGQFTYYTIDRGFDCYVAVSRSVRDFLRAFHDIDAPHIPPFIEEPVASAPLPALAERRGVLLISKSFDEASQMWMHRAVAQIKATFPDEEIQIWSNAPHNDLLAAMRQARAVVSLSYVEGFGLMGLEAMAQGAIVIATDTRGGRDYMRGGDNCILCPLDGVEAAIAGIRRALSDDPRNEAMRAAAIATATAYTRDAFEANWRDVMGKVISGVWRQPRVYA